MPAPTLETSRLILRPYTTDDISALLPLIGAREVAATTLRIPHPYSESVAREFIAMTERENASGQCVRLCVIVRESNALCGGVGLQVDATHQRAELGYWIGVPFWRNGYASEAATELVRYGFESLKLHRIFASYFSGNDASKNVLEKIGMKYEGCQRGHFLKWGEFFDSELYGMLAEDWARRGPTRPQR
jgi:[ribosomal protein S5]-alanine N-acetyltransferase